MCLTIIAFLAGALLIMAYAFKSGIPELDILMMIMVWAVIDIFIVSPLIYLPFLPKPVRKHIKRIDSLTAYEEKIKSKEELMNPRTERILKRYRGVDVRAKERQEKRSRKN